MNTFLKKSLPDSESKLYKKKSFEEKKERLKIRLTFLKKSEPESESNVRFYLINRIKFK
jgi:hypothetical protein